MFFQIGFSERQEIGLLLNAPNGNCWIDFVMVPNHNIKEFYFRTKQTSIKQREVTKAKCITQEKLKYSTTPETVTYFCNKKNSGREYK